MQVEDLGPRSEDYYEQHEKAENWRKKPAAEQGPDGAKPEAIPQPIGYGARLKAILKRLARRG